MSSNFFKSFYGILIILIVLIFFISCFFAPAILGNTNILFEDIFYSFDLNDAYIWPSPGYTTINSYFGYRTSPTAGASSYHKGLDIGAPQGSNLVAVCDGQITFTGFLGGGGYTITLTSGNIKFTYCHVSPNYIVKTGDNVKKGQVIGKVGPKNVYGVKR